MLLPNPAGGYSFIKGLSPYSAGVVAGSGFAIEHVRFLRPIPWREGFQRVEAHLRSSGRPRQALCAVALRSPKPFTFGGFNQFNTDYEDLLKSWGLLVDGLNPIARTNVAPLLDPPGQPSMYSFAYTMPVKDARPSFVVAGAGELPEGSLDPHDVVRRGETSPNAMAEKARYVCALMDGRVRGLGVTWNDVSVTNIYTAHDLNALLPSQVLPRMGQAAQHGVVWHYARPPIESIEYEMDLRGCSREIVL